MSFVGIGDRRKKEREEKKEEEEHDGSDDGSRHQSYSILNNPRAQSVLRGSPSRTPSGGAKCFKLPCGPIHLRDSQPDGSSNRPGQQGCTKFVHEN